MNINKLNELVNSSKLNKVQIAEKCGVSRTTLDNVLAGADAKISTIESLAKVLGISIGALFGDAREDILSTSINGSSELEFYKREVERLQTLLNNQKKSTKVVVELDVDDDEFIKMGLKDKVIQILNK
ncbi:helix-turn-helix domain-containing protein [Bacteroides clarus]|uniref:helix-turn-helix domain-containing protein n=1 Tax=Bacteroides clarus TaxID=626929 RepID=UPI001899F9E2|nr:helix-turn-helix transcriptional regulator [Bacteroides clarus]